MRANTEYVFMTKNDNPVVIGGAITYTKQEALRELEKARVEAVNYALARKLRFNDVFGIIRDPDNKMTVTAGNDVYVIEPVRLHANQNRKSHASTTK